MLAPLGIILLFVVVGAWCSDSVADNVGPHTMSRIAELLSPSECRQLRQQLTGPHGDLGEWELELQLLSEKNNPMRPRRQRRSPVGCSAALRHWLGTAGKVTPWDRLVRGLRQIGRPDIARELGKNLNQDRSLELRRNVEEYGRSVQHLTSSLLLEGGQHGSARAKRALGLRDLEELGDLRFERQPPPPYTRSLLGWLGPVVSGILGGFLASIVFTVAVLYSYKWILGPDAA
ncbi:transmembrane and death domain protein 1 [Porphyrio hochstetteri]